MIELHDRFRELMFDQGIPLLSFGEGQKTKVPLNLKLMIVPAESSGEWAFYVTGHTLRVFFALATLVTEGVVVFEVDGRDTSIA